MAVSCSLDYLCSPGMFADSWKCTFWQPERSLWSLFCLCLYLGIWRHSAARSGMLRKSSQNQHHFGGNNICDSYIFMIIDLSYLPCFLLRLCIIQARSSRQIVLTLAGKSIAFLQLSLLSSRLCFHLCLDQVLPASCCAGEALSVCLTQSASSAPPPRFVPPFFFFHAIHIPSSCYHLKLEEMWLFLICMSEGHHILSVSVTNYLFRLSPPFPSL